MFAKLIKFSSRLVSPVLATGPGQGLCTTPSRFYNLARASARVPTRTMRTDISCTVSRYHSSDATSDAVKAVADLVRSHRVVVFMKGDPDQPQCGFSNAVCRILEMHGVLEKAKKNDQPNLFASYNVLESDELRSACKTFSDWPTFPQVYLDGEFIGGCDILLDMHRSGKLTEELERRGIESALKTTQTGTDQ